MAELTFQDEFADTSPRGPTEAQLASVVRLAEDLSYLDTQIEEHEAKLKLLQDKRRAIAEGDLPAAMDSCGERGLLSLTLGGGERVVLSTKYRCGQLDDRASDPRKEDTKRPLGKRLEALKWLEQGGHGDLVKRTIVITLGRSSEAAEQAIRDFFTSLRLNSANLESLRLVAWNTLSAFVRNLDSQADGSGDLPLDLLGVQKVRVAEVKHASPEDRLT